MKGGFSGSGYDLPDTPEQTRKILIGLGIALAILGIVVFYVLNVSTII